MNNRLALVILDGVGIAENTAGNAVFLADMQTYEQIKKEGLTTLIKTSGSEVGLVSEKDAGNSEVGHNAIGSGQLIKQGLALIDEQIKSGEVFKTQIWRDVCENTFKNNKKLHFIGLTSEGRVHSDIHHLFAMLTSAKQFKAKDIYIHALIDGRDAPPQSAPHFLKMLEDYIKDNNINAKIATVAGRDVLVMDRYESRIHVIENSFKVYVEGKAPDTKNIFKELERIYKENPKITDETIDAFILDRNGLIDNGDSVVLFNYRGDRAIELCEMFDNGKYADDAKSKLGECLFTGFTQYDPESGLPKRFLVQPPKITNTLTEWLSKKGIKQYSITESYKFGHLSYYFNGNRRDPFVPELETYDEIKSDIAPIHTQPKMKTKEIADGFIAALNNPAYKFLKTNYSNGDMVGHTGNLEATIEAMKEVDIQLRRVYEECKKLGVTLIVTSDHGNAEVMIENNGERCTKHTANEVYFTLLDFKNRFKLNDGKFGLTNIAATICEVLEIEPRPVFRQSIVSKKGDKNE